MTYFQLVLEEVFLIGKFAVEAEQSLLVCGQGLAADKGISLSSCGVVGELALTLISILFF